MKKYASRNILSAIRETVDGLSEVPTDTYTVLRNGYDHPFYYNEAIDFEVHDAEGGWLLMITPDFHEFWPLEQVRDTFQYAKGTWTSSKRHRERHRRIDTEGLS
jgi:hypothetical protein